MKKLVKITSLALCLMLTLTACSAVFDSAISGTVKDRSVRETSSSSSGAIADVMVYAYDNEEEWNSKYNSWDGESVFVDNTVPSAKTAADGSFSIANLRWLTSRPAYGKDADSRTIYLLAFHKDYGLVKVDGRTIQSDKSNNFGIVYMDKATVTKTLVIKLKDSDDNSTTSAGTDSTVSSTTGISFRYKYADGYDGTNQNVGATIDSFTNGQATITVKYRSDYKDPYKDSEGNTRYYDAPKVTIYDIQTGSDWSMTDSTLSSIDCTYDSSDKEYKNTSVYLTSKWQTVSVTVSLIDGSSTNASASVTDPVTFKWAYNNGEEDKSSTVTTTSGTSSYTISVKYKKTVTDPTLTLSAFKDDDSDDPKWTWTTDKDNAKKRTEEINVSLLDSDKSSLDSVTQKVYFRKNYLTLPSSGISGYLITEGNEDITASTGKKIKATGYGYTCDVNDTLYLYLGDDDTTAVNSNTVRTGRVDTASTSTIISDYGHFAGLGSGIKVPLTYADDDSGFSGDKVDYKGTAAKLTVRYKASGSVDLSDPKSNELNYNSMTTDFTVMLYK